MQEKPLYEPVEDTGIKNFDIEFRGVSFSYDTESILHDINFKIPEKSVTALVGPSGSGKTTITSLIARFWDVDLVR
jgi:ATP-binding cassette subfamily B protein